MGCKGLDDKGVTYGLKKDSLSLRSLLRCADRWFGKRQKKKGGRES